MEIEEDSLEGGRKWETTSVTSHANIKMADHENPAFGSTPHHSPDLLGLSTILLMDLLQRKAELVQNW